MVLMQKRVMVRRGFLSILGAVLMALAASAAQAQSSKPVRVVVPFGAGGAGDLIARAVSQKMAQDLGQSFVVDNRPGAGGVVAADTVAKAAPDGQTLFLMSSGTAVSASLFKALPYDTLKDLTPVATISSFGLALVVPADSPYKTLGELLTWARANPGQLNIGSVNVGSTQHLTAELFKSTAKVQAQVVPYNGTPALLNALRGKQVHVAVEIVGPVLPQITAGVVRPLAVTGERRLRALPQVPTAVESGVPGLVAASWNGFAAPANTAPEVVNKLNAAVNAALASPDVEKRLQALSADPMPGTTAQAAALLTSDIKRWGEVIDKARIPRQ